MKKGKKWNKMLLAAALTLGLVLAGCASVTGAALNSGPAKTVYGQGQELELAGIKAEVNYSNGKVKYQDIKDSAISGYDKHTPGTQTVHVNITNFWGTTIGTGTFEVRVAPLLSIAVASPPSQKSFKQGEDLNADGLSVRGAWDEIGEGAIPASEWTLSGYDKDKYGNQTVTVSFEGKTANFTVSVMRMVALSLTKPANKTRYFTGNSIDLSGLALTGTFMDGENPVQLPVAVKSENVSGFDSSYVGRQKVTITVAGNSVSYDVTVEKADPVPAALQGRWYRDKDRKNLAFEFTGDAYKVSIVQNKVRSVANGVIHFENNAGESQGSVRYSIETEVPYEKLTIKHIDYNGLVRVDETTYWRIRGQK
ncbi:hypothetical protein AGMMS50267_03760 [Spirochaetia bacterium]|nr:hypothetical protein AGMMS50267_03760 [Spirochaetia bacterium]